MSTDRNVHCSCTRRTTCCVDPTQRHNLFLRSPNAKQSLNVRGIFLVLILKKKKKKSCSYYACWLFRNPRVAKHFKCGLKIKKSLPRNCSFKGIVHLKIKFHPFTTHLDLEVLPEVQEVMVVCKLTCFTCKIHKRGFWLAG